MGVKVRYKDRKDNKQSIYLDIYKDKKRKYEFLEDLYRYAKPTTAEEKAFNKLVDAEVEKIVAGRVVELLNHRLSFANVDKANKDFLKSFKEFSDKQFQIRGPRSNTYCSYKHFSKFCGGSMMMKELSTEVAEGFREYLLKNLSQNFAKTCFLKFKQFIITLHKKGIIDIDPTLDVPPIKEHVPQRVFLSEEELESLKKAPCKYDLIKRMFLFGCYTGLRISDLKEIKWSNVKDGRLTFRPVKTPKKIHVVPLNKNAQFYMGERGEPSENVFPWPFQGDGNRYDIIRDWVRQAGITTNVTWHTGRHTCATLMLLKTGNLKAVKEGLGHSNIHTTEIYAQLLGRTLVEAFESMDN
ncbi:tyrosine-type recombinase/integrase [Rufibacter sediminis]|uniref:Site-specific integrase n=1 Tax=Rufibacter sediminis TaxID=2762756 RepID=A0ABR6VTG5_9BACT|nr:site-specific integrase [Rufibacter sediminis]MBC3540434.1 site-specific integrase [Rufibacter sediminis]